MSAVADVPWQARFGRLSLVFAPGQRPSADAISALLQASDPATTAFAISDAPPSAPGRLELLAAGWAFALTGLAPAAGAAIPPMAHRYGLANMPDEQATEAIGLTLADDPGAQTPLLPVTRMMAGLAARLAALAHVWAVVWHPARSAIAPQAFATAIAMWLGGGAFPTLALAALFRDASGAMRSEGLAFFTGRELLIEPHPGINTALTAKIAARLVNELVGSDGIQQRAEFLGPNGEIFSVEPSGNDRILRVWFHT